ncbi:MAG: hypothetical protein IJK55_00150 [Bacteroidales bacterium]|nr:hypothetical protein [Bacteroidales bacterium]
MCPFSVIFTLLFAIGMNARPAPGPTEPCQPRFVNYLSAEGLPSNTVYALAQDMLGALLVGTRGGLSRFDGEHFRTLIPGKRINALAVDPGNRIWAGTTEGLQVIEMPGLAVSEAYRGGNIRALLADSAGYVWATVGDSLLVKLSFSPENGIREEARTPYNKRYHEGDYPYFQLYEDREGTLWLGGRIVRTQFVQDRNHPRAHLRYSDSCCTGSYAEVGGTLYAFDDSRGTLNSFGETDLIDHGRLPISHARLLADSQGRLWVAGSYGMGLVNPENPEATRVFTHDPNDPASLSSAELYCLFEDRQGNLWAGGDNGLSLLCPGLQQVQTISTGQVTALLQTRDGKLWIGTHDERVSSLYEDREGAVYIGYWNNTGFDIIQDGKRRHGKISGPIDPKQHNVAWEDRSSYNWIADFLESRDGRFYVVSWEGVGINEWDRETGRTLPPEWLSPFFYPQPPLDSAIYLSSRLGSRLIEDAKGNLAYGTTEAGLNLIDKSTRLVTKYLPNPLDSLSIPDNYVTDLCLAPNGTLWVATRAGLWTPGRAPLLKGKLVQSVRADAKGRLWAGTEEGLYFVDTDGSIGRVRKELGFPSDIFGEKTACVLTDGRLAFGGLEGAAVFHPDSLLAIRTTGNLPLQKFVQHRYRLNRGAWTPGRFSGMPEGTTPGRYTLEEQDSDLFGRWEKGTSTCREIRVPLPLWLRWPFLLLYLLLIGALVWTIIHQRERRLLMAQLDTRNRFFSIISHDLRNPVSGNRLLARQLLEQVDKLSPAQMKEGLQALSASAENTGALLENLLLWSLNQKGMLEPAMREENLRELAAEAAGSVQDSELIELDIPPTLTVRTDRNMLLTCLRNVLDNAVKASPTGGKVSLKARERTITITDEGPGKKEGSAWGHGLGLVITHELLGKMDATMQARNLPGKGLEITIHL